MNLADKILNTLESDLADIDSSDRKALNLIKKRARDLEKFLNDHPNQDLQNKLNSFLKKINLN